MHVYAGQVLWRPEDVSDSMYIVINGRLRAITENEEDAYIQEPKQNELMAASGIYILQ